MKMTTFQLFSELQHELDLSIQFFNTLKITYSIEQLQKKPAPNKWSAAECIHHLIRTADHYFPQFEALKDTAAQDEKDQKLTPRFFGKLMVKAMKPKGNNVTWKMSTFDNFQPDPTRSLSSSLIDDYITYLNRYHTFIRMAKHLDANKQTIISAIGPILKFSLADALHFLIAHNSRHKVQINQTLSILNNKP